MAKVLNSGGGGEVNELGIRRIDSFQEYRDACTKMREITDMYNAAAEDLDQLKTSAQAACCPRESDSFLCRVSSSRSPGS